MSAGRRELRLDLPCVHRAVRTGRRVVQTFARTEGLPDEEIERLMLVTSELLANAVDHGGGMSAMTEEDLAGDVRMGLLLAIEEGGWRLEVEDSGGGSAAEAEELVARSQAPDLEDERGRGLFLVREMVSELGVRPGESGLVFVAIKRLAGV